MSVASSWADEVDEEEDGENHDPFLTVGGGGDQSGAPDEWASNDRPKGDQNIPVSDFAPQPQRNVESGARLPDSDPFVLANL